MEEKEIKELKQKIKQQQGFMTIFLILYFGIFIATTIGLVINSIVYKTLDYYWIFLAMGVLIALIIITDMLIMQPYRQKLKELQEQKKNNK